MDVRAPDAPESIRVLWGSETLAQWFAREILATAARPAPAPPLDSSWGAGS